MVRVSSGINPQIILVAEDDPNDSLLLKLAFDKAGTGASLKFVRDGEEAVAYIRGEREFADREHFPFPSMLLLDLDMPKKNGLEVLRDLQNDPSTEPVITIILTSSASPSDINLALDLGANSYIFKPRNQPALVAVAKRLGQYGPHEEQLVAEMHQQLLLANG